MGGPWEDFESGPWDDFKPADTPSAAEAAPAKSDPSILDKVAEIGKKGILTSAREAFSKNPEPALNVLPQAGMVAGGALGGPLGAAAGGVAGETLRQFGKAGTTGEAATPLDAIAEMGKAGATGAAAEGASMVAGKALPKILRGGRAAGRAMAKGYGKVAEFFSGVPASDIARLADDPAAILPEVLGGSKSTAKAGKAFGKAVKDSGFLPEAATSGEMGLAKFAGRQSPFKSSDSVADGYFNRVASGEELAPPELYDAYQSAQEAVSKMSRKNPRYVEMLDFKNALQTELQSLSGEYAQASQDFARAAVGRSTSNLLPRTATGKVSLGRTGFANLVAPGIGTVLSSPAFYGGTTAAVSGAAKGLAAVVGNPTARRVAFSEIVKRARSKKK